jgi:hypothetical protein
MKKTFFWTLFVILMLLFTACSEKDDNNTTTPNTPNPPQMATNADSIFAMPAQDTVFPDSLLTDISYIGETTASLPLTHFITKEMTDALVSNTSDDETQKLFAYQLIASDGFNPRDRGYNDLTWDVFKTGVLLPNKSFRSYFASEDVETAFDVKYLSQIKMFRAVQVIKADGSKVLFEMNALAENQVANYDSLMEAGIKLSSFITDFVTTTPADYDYVFTDNGSYTQQYTWAQIQDGYWLKDSKRTIFPSFPEMPNLQKKFKKLMQIQLVPKA